jgi:hypothetical protein
VTVTTTTPGQNAKLLFSGTAGQKVFVKLTGVTFTSHTTSLLRPDGTTLASTTGTYLDTQTLPVPGTYTLFVNPALFYTGSATVTLSDVVDLTGTITPGGPPVTVTTTTPGQVARLTFAGTAGQRVFLNVTAATTTSTLSITNPDGTYLASPVSMGNGFIDTRTLPATGTYTVTIDPNGPNTGSLTLTLADVPPDVTGTLAIGSPAVTVTTTTPGQNGALTVSGTAGQPVTVRVTRNTVGTVTVTLKKPDGTTLTSSTSGAASFTLTRQTLATTGTYTVNVDPSGANMGSLTVRVTSS